MDQAPKKTRLNKWHRNHGANMAVFAGYEMPLWYPVGTRKEHLSVIMHTGLFDTSHMAIVMVTGAGAFDLLQNVFSKDLTQWKGKTGSIMPHGSSVYGVFLNQEGAVIDDALLYKISDDCFMNVVNASMGGQVAAHLEAYKKNYAVEIEDLTDKIGKIDIQGPLSARLLLKVLKDPNKILNTLVYFGFKGFWESSRPHVEPVKLMDGTSVLLSRTGYTGEFGFELFMESAKLESVWELILDAGKEFGIQTCGLAARDSLRTGAVLPLSHQDIGAWPYVRHPWAFSLPYNNKKTNFTKEFIGSHKLLQSNDADHTFPFVGFDPRKIVTEKAGVYGPDGKHIGKVLTCTTDMAISRHNNQVFSIASQNKPVNFKPRGLACGFVKIRPQLKAGSIVYLTDERRKIKVTIENDIRPDRTARSPMAKMIAD